MIVYMMLKTSCLECKRILCNNFSKRGWYSMLANFVEIGESLTRTNARTCPLWYQSTDREVRVRRSAWAMSMYTCHTLGTRSRWSVSSRRSSSWYNDFGHFRHVTNMLKISTRIWLAHFATIGKIVSPRLKWSNFKLHLKCPFKQSRSLITVIIYRIWV